MELHFPDIWYQDQNLLLFQENNQDPIKEQPVDEFFYEKFFEGDDRGAFHDARNLGKYNRKISKIFGLECFCTFFVVLENE